MKSKQWVLDHPSQLESLSVLPILRTRALGSLRLAGGLAGHPRRDEWERRLNRHYYACGCDTSAKGLLLGLVAGGAWGLLRTGVSWTAVGWILGGALGGALLGKAVGLLRAQARLRETVREIRAEWKVELPAETVEAISCG